ncbi:unnamed protein product, partial [Mycena citricolor]
ESPHQEAVDRRKDTCREHQPRSRGSSASTNTVSRRLGSHQRDSLQHGLLVNHARSRIVSVVAVRNALHILRGG